MQRTELKNSNKMPTQEHRLSRALRKSFGIHLIKVMIDPSY